MIDHHFSFTTPDRLDEAPFTSWADGIKDIDEDDRSDVPSPQPTTSRAAAIAGYRKEMMELVRDVPESAYELSLKDLVELSPMAPRMETLQEGKAKKKVAPQRRMSRNESMDAGVFLLKMFMPFSFGGGKRGKSSRRSSGGSLKVSPKPISGDRSSSSGSNSSSSSSSTSNSMNRKLISCCSFFLGQKRKGEII